MCAHTLLGVRRSWSWVQRGVGRWVCRNSECTDARCCATAFGVSQELDVQRVQKVKRDALPIYALLRWAPSIHIPQRLLRRAHIADKIRWW